MYRDARGPDYSELKKIQPINDLSYKNYRLRNLDSRYDGEVAL